jgi:hypothetical protein
VIAPRGWRDGTILVLRSHFGTNDRLSEWVLIALFQVDRFGTTIERSLLLQFPILCAPWKVSWVALSGLPLPIAPD